MYLLKKENLVEALNCWKETFDVYAPMKHSGVVDLLPFIDSEDFTEEYVNFALPIKKYLFGQKEELFKWEKKNDRIELSHIDGESFKERVYFGVRPCDTYSITYLDQFFYERYKDNIYAVKREKAYFVAINCTSPGSNCFCNSTGTGPFATKGYDILFTPIDDGYLVEIGTSRGEELIAIAAHLFMPISEDMSNKKKAVYELALSRFTKKLRVSDVKQMLEESFDDEIWIELSKTCMGCTGCTNVCPTCTCFNVVDEDNGDGTGSRVRYWDSCQADSFTRNAGGHNPRDEVSRVRYRIYDKMKYIDERYGFKGCVGCGRCIDACPVYIDIVEIVEKLGKKYSDKVIQELEKKAKENTKVVPEQHECSDDCSYVYTPKVAIIKDIIQETSDIKRFVVQYEDKSLHESLKYTGQFFKITVFGVGEIAISIPSGDFKKDYLEFYIKKAGKVTTVLHNMKIGDKIGLRGPFGKGFPVDELKGRDILIIGSGVGLAPVRTAIERVTENRRDYGKVVIIASSRSYENLIYRNDLIEWSKLDGIKVLYALAKPTNEVDAYVGYMNDLIKDLDFDWDNSTAIICASPNRIKSVSSDLLELGLDGKNILTSLETHMRCGIGKCGHCKVGSKYMCVDGPVFNYEEMLTLPPEF
ncbi:Anaerobic sulfite reductase subunit B [Proteiniborus sp. DW1]|uniref:4Fe-4S dicluster domain-containing protein n=1 Tax=Proteiniborus sp. DW1 TaxID=1889883 RepID=UPI00092E0826|nr:4Fe-4S dicluster domain-containing protein [Proteiniborus sp. DW1]SCG82432.1 Anaerobic sulfite reductase subunit B [Proteiniborus sp. DW1]